MHGSGESDRRAHRGPSSAELDDVPGGRAESDQLPEEQPERAVVDDAGGEARDRAETSAGGASHEDRTTGQPGDRRQGERSA